MYNHAPQELVVTAATKAQLEVHLSGAIDRIRDTAMIERRRGILVTHQAPGQFKVTLSDEVPFGLTRQKVAW